MGIPLRDANLWLRLTGKRARAIEAGLTADGPAAGPYHGRPADGPAQHIRIACAGAAIDIHNR